jgi:hypothetical protein
MRILLRQYVKAFLYGFVVALLAIGLAQNWTRG